MEVSRNLAQQPEAIQRWFEKLLAKIQELGILHEDMWNMDETGCRIGVAKNQYVYTRHGKQIFIPHSNNRELISLVECCSANGDIIEPMIIIKASTILEKWVIDLPDDYLINVSDSGYSNDETSLDWIKHFNRMTRHRTQGTWRLLLLDGYGSYHIREFIKYAERNRIQLFGSPPYTTHFLQVLDVGCFQPLKWYHGRMLDWAARTGSKDISKDDFLATIH
ncbi:CENP-B protein [Zopfia rhizophila CBS 207.26]|uniref:CENP-B protein n=1 Tax=Zopfia rhizophila CBS 207.26 TaxID=1314779 RepID=A0A6A6E0P2_9PEZI|nr:CENP-B protein [Zopfia rhizophila CBS 207.26]